MVQVHHWIPFHDPQILLFRSCCSSTVNDYRLTYLSRQSTNPGKHICFLNTTFVLPRPDVIQTYISHRDTINSMYTPFQIFTLPVREFHFWCFGGMHTNNLFKWSPGCGPPVPLLRIQPPFGLVRHCFRRLPGLSLPDFK